MGEYAGAVGVRRKGAEGAANGAGVGGVARAGPRLHSVESGPIEAAEGLEVLQGACFFKGLGVEFDGGVGVKHTRAAARALLAAWRG